VLPTGPRSWAEFEPCWRTKSMEGPQRPSRCLSRQRKTPQPLPRLRRKCLGSATRHNRFVPT